MLNPYIYKDQSFMPLFFLYINMDKANLPKAFDVSIYILAWMLIENPINICSND